MIGLDVRSCCPTYYFPSSLKSDAVALSWCYHCCDGPRCYPTIVGEFHVDTVSVAQSQLLLPKLRQPISLRFQ